MFLADRKDCFIIDLKTSGLPTEPSDTDPLTINEQSACSNVVCVVSTELYGSTTELAN